MPSHNVTSAKEEMKNDIFSHDAPKEEEASTTIISRRPSRGSNLMQKRSNLMNASSMTNSGKSATESVLAPKSIESNLVSQMGKSSL